MKKVKKGRKGESEVKEGRKEVRYRKGREKVKEGRK